MKRCEVCGRIFRVKKDDVYTVSEAASLVDAFVTGKPMACMNAIDCPRCGCQKLLSIRWLKEGEK